MLARRQSLAWEDETPESILRIGIRRADATLRAIQIGRWHLALIAGFVVVLWLLADAGQAIIDRWHDADGTLPGP